MMSQKSDIILLGIGHYSNPQYTLLWDEYFKLYLNIRLFIAVCEWEDKNRESERWSNWSLSYW